MSCKVVLTGVNGKTYKGKLASAIEDPQAARFWADFEGAVDDVALVHVDQLEARLAALPYFVVFDGRTFRATEVDLQIMPSEGSFSFTVP